VADFWEALTPLHQAFIAAAIFFSTIFVWQLISAFGSLGEAGADAADSADGIDGADGVDMDLDSDMPDLAEADGGDDLLSDATGLTTFRLLSVRSMIAFCTLFTWGGALYLGQDITPAGAILRALLWGLAGMLVVAAFFWLLPHLSETGTSDLRTALNQTGEVYLNIPEGGAGQVKVLVSGALRFVRARSADGEPIAAGTPVRVTHVIDDATLEVQAIRN